MEVKVPPDAGAGPPSVIPEVGTDVPGWTLLSRSYHRVGRWMSEMASTGRYGLGELKRGLLRETRDGMGGRGVCFWERPAGVAAAGGA